MRIWKILAAAILLCAGLASVLTAQTVLPREDFRLSLDIARFRGADDTHSTMELYYGFPQRGLTFITDSTGLAGAADLTIIVRRADSTVHAERWLVPHVLKDTSDAAGTMSMVGAYALSLPDGEYLITLLGRDRKNPKRMDSVSVRLPVRPFGVEKAALSDVEFATMIRQGGAKESPFYKNTLEVIPNVGGIYSEQQACFYYAEAYNLLTGEDRSDFMMRTNVYDAIGKEVLSRERPKKRAGESSVLVDQFSVAKLKTGTYTLAVSLLDSSRKVMTTSARKFFVFNSVLGVDSTLLSSASNLPLAEYMAMDEAELDRESRWSRWEMMEVEKDQYAALTGIDAKRKFLSDFWRKRGPGYRDEYLSRVAYANSNFNMMGREGYRTDRGRVQVTYGVPDDVERHPNETDSKPYEIWSYHGLQGGVIFVFVQRSQGGDYELVHSTHRNELHDENWDRVGISR